MDQQAVLEQAHLIGQLSVFEGNLADTEPRHPAPPGGLPATDLVGDDPSHAYRQVAQPVPNERCRPMRRRSTSSSAYLGRDPGS